MTAPDVVVVGAGAIGLASAWRLAQRGLAVEIVDPEPGGGASVVAGGMLAPVTEARIGEEELLRLGVASLNRWPDFDAELSASASGDSSAIGFRRDGTVSVALDADDRAALRDLVDRQRSLGLDIADLSTADLRSLEPALAPGVRRGAMAKAERSVDPIALVARLLTTVEQAGVTIRRDRVRSLAEEPETGRVVGVDLADGGHLPAGTVVLAAGSWSGEVAGGPSGVMPVPVRPVKGQVATLRQRPGDRLVQHTVRGYVRSSVVYMVPRGDGRLICGATVEEKGWDATSTVGAAYEVLRDVLALYPGLDEAELVGLRTGFRPATPDDLPLIGRTGVDGLVVATGHFRNGILLTPVTADAVAALVTGASPPAEVALCDPTRFRRSDPRRTSTTQATATAASDE